MVGDADRIGCGPRALHRGWAPGKMESRVRSMLTLVVFLLGLLALGIGMAIFAVWADKSAERKHRSH